MSRRLLSVLVLVVSMLLVGCSTAKDSSRTERLKPSVGVDELQQFAKARVFFGHQSVGDNILAGVEHLYANSGIGAPIIQSTGVPTNKKAFLAHELVGANGDPQSKLDEFAELLATGLGDQVEVAILKFCYVDITSGSDVERIFENYSAVMEGIARKYPDLRLIYTTVPLSTEASLKSKLKGLVTGTTPPYTADNIARERYNAMVRDRYESTGRLFDIARIESTADGLRVSGDYSGVRYFALNEDLAVDSGHLNEAGSILAAAEFVRVIAGSTATDRG